MGFDFNNDIPIYLQIIEQIKIKIISKEYLPNQKIPSVREFSVEFGVNPNTVQKALVELESTGLIYTERTNGKYVTDDKKLIDRATKEALREVVDNFYQSMGMLGFDKKQTLDLLNKEN